MFHRFKLAAAIAVTGALLLGAPAMAWDWPFGTAVVGSGQVTKTQRQLTGFKGLSLELPSNVEIVQGDTEGVLIETDQNIAPLIETVVENDQLKIRSVSRSQSLKPTSLKITVQARTIEHISISGSGDVKARKLQSSTLEARISGSGDIHIDTLDTDSLTVAISGSGDFFAGGRANTARLNIAGSGDVKAGTLAAKNVTLSIAGAGAAKVWATETLNVRIAGSGDVEYFGDAAVSKSVAGSGRVRRLATTPNSGG
ncbi:MAG: head GIN domain-containing protein [Comamonadaceae bacterium]